MDDPYPSDEPASPYCSRITTVTHGVLLPVLGRLVLTVCSVQTVCFKVSHKLSAPKSSSDSFSSSCYSYIIQEGPRWLNLTVCQTLCCQEKQSTVSSNDTAQIRGGGRAPDAVVSRLFFLRRKDYTESFNKEAFDSSQAGQKIFTVGW